MKKTQVLSREEFSLAAWLQIICKWGPDAPHYTWQAN